MISEGWGRNKKVMRSNNENDGDGDGDGECSGVVVVVLLRGGLGEPVISERSHSSECTLPRRNHSPIAPGS